MKQNPLNMMPNNEKVSDVTNRSPSTRRTFCWQYGLKPEPEVFRDVIVAHFPVVTR